MRKHAYIIVVNSNFKVVKTCLRLLDDLRNDIYLLVDKKTKTCDDICADLKQIVVWSRIVFVCKSVNLGGYSQIDAVLTLLDKVLSDNQKYTYIHFLQGSDLPIKSQDHIHHYFDEQNNKEYVNMDKQNTFGNFKCQYYHLFCDNKYFRFNRIVKAFNFGFVTMQKIFGIRRNTDIKLYHGSALFSITANFAAHVLSRKAEIKKRFRWTLAADEVFLQTILMSSPYKDNTIAVDIRHTSNARLIDWTRSRAKNSPHIWTMDEFDYLVNQPCDICFARKFDESSDFAIVVNLCRWIKNR